MKFKENIRNIEDFPKKGILFRDITTILQEGDLLHEAVEEMAKKLENIDFDIVVAPEARGFILGSCISYKLKKGFVPVRKKGKLPFETIEKEYNLEYGNNIMEIHKDALKNGKKVVIIDDLLATGGTCKGICELIERLKGEVVSIVFFIELKDLKGREILSKYNVDSVVKY